MWPNFSRFVQKGTAKGLNLWKFYFTLLILSNSRKVKKSTQVDKDGLFSEAQMPSKKVNVTGGQIFFPQRPNFSTKLAEQFFPRVSNTAAERPIRNRNCYGPSSKTPVRSWIADAVKEHIHSKETQNVLHPAPLRIRGVSQDHQSAENKTCGGKTNGLELPALPNGQCDKENMLMDQPPQLLPLSQKVGASQRDPQHWYK